LLRRVGIRILEELVELVRELLRLRLSKASIAQEGVFEGFQALVSGEGLTILRFASDAVLETMTSHCLIDGFANFFQRRQAGDKQRIRIRPGQGRNQSVLERFQIAISNWRAERDLYSERCWSTGGGTAIGLNDYRSDHLGPIEHFGDQRFVSNLSGERSQLFL